MGASDWVLIVTTLFLGAIAIFTPAISKMIKKKWFGPSIAITFDISHPSFLISVDDRNSVLVDEDDGYPKYYFQFLIENTGASTLKSCEVVIERIWNIDSDGNPYEFKGFQSANLLWAPQQLPIINIRPHRKKYCFLGHISTPEYHPPKNKMLDILELLETQNKFYFEVEEKNSLQPYCLHKGNYMVKVVIYSDNANTEELWFRISWAGLRGDTFYDLLSGLNIELVEPAIDYF